MDPDTILAWLAEQMNRSPRERVQKPFGVATGVVKSMWENPARTVADFTPGLGDGLALKDAWTFAQEDQPLLAALSAASIIPGVPGIARHLGKAGKAARAVGDADLPMDQASRLARARDMDFHVESPVYHGTSAPDDFDRFDLGADTEWPSRNQGLGVFTTHQPGSRNKGGAGFFAHDPSRGMESMSSAELDEFIREWVESVGNPGELSRILPLFMRSPKHRVATGDLGYERLRLDLAREDLPLDMQDYLARRGPGASQDPAFRNLRDQAAAMRGDEVRDRLMGQGYTGLRLRTPPPPPGQRLSTGLTAGETWDVVFDPANLRSIFAKFDPARLGDPDLLGAGAGLLAARHLTRPEEGGN
jgi:hypothetical protein